MGFLKLPATLRWGLVNCLVLWFVMTIYRFVLTVLLSDGLMTHINIVFSGWIIDLGALAIPALFFILFSFIPALHPFKSRFGKFFGMILFCFFGFVFALIYGFDLLWIKTFASRISGGSIHSILDDPLAVKQIGQAIPFWTFTTGIIVLVWVWKILIEWIYKTLGTKARAEKKGLRMTWQALIILLFTAALLASINYHQNQPEEDLSIKENFEKSIKLNPVLTLLFK